ncbi:MAG: hypothetical protein ACP5NX_03855 [Candidatus Bilamarchaeaceae archaeon]
MSVKNKEGKEPKVAILAADKSSADNIALRLNGLQERVLGTGFKVQEGLYEGLRVAVAQGGSGESATSQVVALSDAGFDTIIKVGAALDNGSFGQSVESLVSRARWTSEEERKRLSNLPRLRGLGGF